ncbi:NAD(P)/FAD-dependent oxidoreductase [Desulfobacula toluolica]|uniref:FAD-dependent oxidoreductase n=1 Tax=Desulfobacula toluolica (strain DSM 7467 / Tol2) TaxID=651182 RepID=K0N9W9_DESTT|nr:NAD(P)/FAD-dependent oxidoreductase [Desulfobacula toluolica]CCK80799.1 FAD-dependent oxidoreductase [Desulfobacula toluolica Tol2]
MIKQITLRVSSESVHDSKALKKAAAKALKIPIDAIDAVQTRRCSLDARSKMPVFELQVLVYSGEPVKDLLIPVSFKPVSSSKKIIVVGSGPAGLFAALRLIEHGIIPVVLERGKDVKQRRFDLKTINADGICNQDSNYCFGEGGAGTYSDGKLYTRSTKRGNVGRMLSILVQHGANHDILVNAHPHIGSNKLPGIIKSIRNTILSCNGEIHFNTRVKDLIMEHDRIKGVRTDNDEFLADGVILATGHSARDVYMMLDRCGIALESKPFAMGVRVEHPQEIINFMQYGKNAKSHDLPAASYSFSCQVGKTGVYSFCMCPGGMLVPAATSPGELVLNGMSNSYRNLSRANAGMVVTIDASLHEKYSRHKYFSGIELQKELEKKAFEAGGKTLAAPAQRLTDFLEDKLSAELPKTSYIPGAVSYPLSKVLGPVITEALKSGFGIFNRQKKGYVTREAVVLAVESRTSSPVRIPRIQNTRMHPQVVGLFPVGEGAGYAGGIVSSALDGEAGADAASALL